MNPGTILVVEDTLESLQLLSAILSTEGYQVLPANSGELAIAAFAVRRPDLVLLDLRMPEMDGMEVLRRLQARDEWRSVPVMMLSAVTDAEERLEGLRLGAVDFVSKPFQREELLARVKTQVKLSRALGLLERRVEDLRFSYNQLEAVMIEHQRVQDELLAANSELRASHETLRSTLATSLDGFWRVDREGRLIDVNPTYTRQSGYTREELLLMRVTDLEAAEGAVEVSRHMQRVVESGGDRFESRHRRKDGSVWDVEVSVTCPDAAAGQLFAFVRDIGARKHSEAVLRDNASKLLSLSRHVLKAQETERRRLAIELHDELGQALTAIKINLQAQDRLEGPPSAELQAENIAIVEEALTQVRRLALALRPAILDDLGLVPALRWIGDQTEERGDLVIQFESSMLQSRLAPEIEIACFRIVQESLNNIVRHARARFVKMDLRQEADSLVLSVQDDGCGFDPAAMYERALTGASMGLLGMQERAALVGGQLDIESSKGQGSRLSLRCPIRTRSEAE